MSIGSQLTRYPPNLTYAQLDQRAKVSYLHLRTQALRAEQAAVAIDALTERFASMSTWASSQSPSPAQPWPAHVPISCNASSASRRSTTYGSFISRVMDATLPRLASGVLKK